MAAQKSKYNPKPPKMAYLFGDSFFDNGIETKKVEKERMFKAYLQYLADGNTKAYSYRRAGLTYDQVAAKRAESTEFAGMEARAVADGVECLEQEAKRRAFGIHEDVWYKGEVVGSKINYSDALLQFLLKAKDPKYREQRNVVSAEINSTVSQGAPSFDASNYTDEELVQLETLLQKGLGAE